MHNSITVNRVFLLSIGKSLLATKLANDKVTRLFISCTLFLLATLALFLLASAVDSRSLDGMPVWHKPIRFGLSFILHFGTLILLSQLIDQRYRTKVRFAFFAYAAAISLWIEYGYIALQAARGRRSHFNFETEVESFMYMVMGVGALFLVAVAFVLGIMIWRYGKKDDSGLRLGAIFGLTLGSLLTLITAGYMSANVTYIEHRLIETANVVPYLGWSRISGDYKPAHFIATHMMQFLPFIGWLMDKTQIGQNLSKKISARKVVWISATAFTLLTGLAFYLALQDIPLFPV